MTAQNGQSLVIKQQRTALNPLSNNGLASISVATTLALAMSAAMMNDVRAEEVSTIDTLVIEESAVAADANPYAVPTAPYKAKRLSDSKHTRDIADTPQTMTVMTKELIEDSGKTELKDILSAQPGITLGTGEGGNSFGDRYIIRGYEARNDVFTDGLREPGLITRETFAIDQVEISKGPSSTFAGRGTTGGAVNVVTKKATLQDDFTTLTGGLGTDSYGRTTIDTNKVINDKFAVRLNTLYTDADIPNRAPAAEQRQGALLSGVYEANDDLTVSADYYYFRSDDKTDPGTRLTDGIPNKTYKYVGQEGMDFQETGADILTLKFHWTVSDSLRIENKTRVGQTNNDYVVSAFSGVSVRRPTGIRQFTGWQESDYFGNQTNFLFDTTLWGKEHNFVSGIEYANEKTDAGNYTVNTTNSFIIDPVNPNNNAWQGNVAKNAAKTSLELNTISAYLMDTIKLNDEWEVSGGLRYDYFDYDLFATPASAYTHSDGFLNGQLGLVYSPWQHGNVYVSWSTSSNINGGESDAGTNCGYGGICTDDAGNYASADPEQSVNYEIGTKWNLFDDNLLLTAAVFKTTKDDVIEGGNDSYVSGGSLNTGKNEVDGIELGLSGNITPKLSGQFGVAIMNSKTLRSYDSENIGRSKANFAEKSASAQLKYQFTPKFAFGGNLTYSSEILGGQPDAGASGSVTLPSYTVFDVFANYQLSEQLGVRANIQNITDKDYYTATYRSGGLVYIGDARSANVNLTYKF